MKFEIKNKNIEVFVTDWFSYRFENLSILKKKVNNLAFPKELLIKIEATLLETKNKRSRL